MAAARCSRACHCHDRIKSHNQDTIEFAQRERHVDSKQNSAELEEAMFARLGKPSADEQEKFR